MLTAEIEEMLLRDLQGQQPSAVSSGSRRLLLIAGAGSGKTEVMARRVAWWLAHGVPKDAVVAFTFTDRAAEEMKFRIRKYIERITSEGDDATLGGMYVGTIHSYCLKVLRDLKPSEYHNYDVVDDVARVALVQRRFHDLLALPALRAAYSIGRTYPASQSETVERFLQAYDLLNEYNELDVELSTDPRPTALGVTEAEWCRQARLVVDVGSSDEAQAFATSAARFYAYLRCRRFLDFSTSQSEAVRLLDRNPGLLEALRDRVSHIVVDEVQDVNPVQDRLVRLLVGEVGNLTAVGDHRQAIFGWRGGRVDIMANLAAELAESPDGEVLELTHNFRSTPRIIDLSNCWNRLIGVPPSLASPDMVHGRAERMDYDPSHVGALPFGSRTDEAQWIAQAIKRLVNLGDNLGARHDAQGGNRGLALSDIAILLRSTSDARTYMSVLRDNGIPSVVRAGPDLFSQPEVLLLVGALGLAAGMDRFLGGRDSKSLPSRIADVLGCAAEPEPVIRAAAAQLRVEGLPLAEDMENRLILAGNLLHRRMADGLRIPLREARDLRDGTLRDFLTLGAQPLRRVFPQSLFHGLLAEVGVSAWDQTPGRPTMAMFHLGQFSSLVTGIETPGWTSTREFPFQIHALLLWGTKNARAEEAPLLVSPDAVQITTVHSAKGLEFAAVFVADVCSSRFPSNQARRAPDLPLDGHILERLNPADLADNAARDGERRLMYVALTRAERYLFVTSSRPGEYYRSRRAGDSPGVANLVAAVGGTADGVPANLPIHLEYLPSEVSRETRLVTSFSDLRYFFECPHDFYLRKVLQFTPTIDQAFGYGRGIHNLLREVHSDPAGWAVIAGDRAEVEERIDDLIGQGQFYLRHTVGEPAERMKAKARAVVADYVQTYRDELAELEFLPEREFETLIEEEQVLISGAIDVVRLDDPPRVTIIDFKSGDPESDDRMSLDEDEMRLQVTMYGLAARHELEFQPDRGLVRYLGATVDDRKELEVNLDEESLAEARRIVGEAARRIRDRQFISGPLRPPRKESSSIRCDECDFLGICGMVAAFDVRPG